MLATRRGFHSTNVVIGANSMGLIRNVFSFAASGSGTDLASQTKCGKKRQGLTYQGSNFHPSPESYIKSAHVRKNICSFDF